MSIAANIHSAERLENGYVKIHLKPIAKGEVAGQPSLLIINFPLFNSLSGLIGIDIWGSSTEIMIGETLWAKRISYTRIELVKEKKK